MSRLAALAELGQSIWIDDLSRDLIRSGELADRVIHYSVTGITSNPTIFASAIIGSDSYEAQIAHLAAGGVSTPEIYAELVTVDIQEACDILRDQWERTSGGDGYVSVEVSPDLAGDTEATVAEAREWSKKVDRPNLYVKVPATPAGIPAIARLIGEGISINVTLIFSLARYAEVMDAYLEGLRRLVGDGGNLSTVNSVASFFVSRFDTEVDRHLPESSPLRGKTAIANARAAYGAFLEGLSTEEWRSLADAGARKQRPLWASTSTKNRDYSDIMYVESLAAADSVNTMPRSTLEAYQDHGPLEPERFGTIEIAAAEETLDALAEAAVSYDEVTATLEEEGVDKFAASYHQLLEAIETERLRLGDRS